MYKNLMEFNDQEIQHKLVIPRLAFAGEKDIIVYGENFGNVTVDIIGILQKKQTKIRTPRMGYGNFKRNGPHQSYAACNGAVIDKALVDEKFKYNPLNIGNRYSNLTESQREDNLAGFSQTLRHKKMKPTWHLKLSCMRFWQTERTRF